MSAPPDHPCPVRQAPTAATVTNACPRTSVAARVRRLKEHRARRHQRLALPLRRQSSTLARGRQQKVCRRPTLLRLPLSARVSLQEPTTVKFRRWSVSRPRIAPPTGRASHSPVVVGQTSRVTQAATKIPRSVILPPYHLLVPIHLVPDHLSQAEAPSTRKTILPPVPAGSYPSPIQCAARTRSNPRWREPHRRTPVSTEMLQHTGARPEPTFLHLGRFISDSRCGLAAASPKRRMNMAA